MSTKICIASSRPIGERCKKWAQEHGYELTSDVDCEVFVSVMYDQLVTEEFIASKRVCFNFHPGILPFYRGAGAYTWGLLNKDKETGVTLHQIDKDIDHGPIIAISKFAIEDGDTAEDLFNRAMEVMFKMFKKWLPKLLVGAYKTSPQNESVARIYYRKDLDAAKDITHIARAFHFPGKEGAYYVNSAGKRVYLEL